MVNSVQNYTDNYNTSFKGAKLPKHVIKNSAKMSELRKLVKEMQNNIKLEKLEVGKDDLGYKFFDLLV